MFPDTKTCTRRLSEAINASLADVRNEIREIAGGVSELQRDQKGNNVPLLPTFAMLASAEHPLDRKAQDIMAWLSTLNFSTRQKDFFNRRQEGTGEWFLKTDAFKNWLDGTERTLWCPGLRMIIPIGKLFFTLSLSSN
jgi:hypothetical protein